MGARSAPRSPKKWSGCVAVISSMDVELLHHSDVDHAL